MIDASKFHLVFSPQDDFHIYQAKQGGKKKKSNTVPDMAPSRVPAKEPHRSLVRPGVLGLTVDIDNIEPITKCEPASI
jgi:hypothetical protein